MATLSRENYAGTTLLVFTMTLIYALQQLNEFFEILTEYDNFYPILALNIYTI